MSQNDHLQIIVTEDGSHSLYVPELDETFHSIHGAITESKKIFIDYGIQDYLSKESTLKLDIWEIGFGTGLNALCTTQFATQHPNISITLHSIEYRPLPVTLLEKLNHGEMLKLDHDISSKIYNAKWDSKEEIVPNMMLCKHLGNAIDFKYSKEIADIVFLDPFGPDKENNPVWEEAYLNRIRSLLKTGGYITTYCAKGKVRRALKASNFIVERLPGPPGKREVLRGTAI